MRLAWRIVDPVLADWARPDPPALAFYTPGGWGPVEADKVLDEKGRVWHVGCGEHTQS
jgi:glucose-6-phosphate 1-dehydrogenase